MTGNQQKRLAALNSGLTELGFFYTKNAINVDLNAPKSLLVNFAVAKFARSDFGVGGLLFKKYNQIVADIIFAR
jgi:hypothetical protein